MRGKKIVLLLCSLFFSWAMVGCGDNSSTPTTVAMPKISPNGGSFTAPQMVTITDDTPGATIYYSFDSVAPSASSTPYKNQISITSSQTLRAVAILSGTSSAEASATFTVNTTPLPTPVISPVGGTFTTAQTVTISDTNSSAAIYYTTDGSTPSATSTRYSGAITISATSAVKAIAVLSGNPDSAVASATFTINYVTPTVSLKANTRAVTQGNTVTLSWSTLNATSCTAASSDGSWTGTVTMSSTGMSITPKTLGMQQFTLTCKNGTVSTLSSVSVTVSAGAASCVDLLIPLYVYPAKTPGTLVSQWTDVVDVNPASGGRKRYVIAGSSTGEATTQDVNYVRAVSYVSSKSGSPMMYVHVMSDPTTNTLRPLADVEADVKRQVSFYQPSGSVGIFVDEVSPISANVSYYKDLVAYIATQQPGATIIFNLGVLPLQTTDALQGQAFAEIPEPSGVRLVLNLAETYYTSFPSQTPMPAWIYQYSSSKFALLLHDMNDASQISTAIDAAIRYNAGMVGLTDLKYPEDYSDLPSSSFYKALTAYTNSGCPL